MSAHRLGVDSKHVLIMRSRLFGHCLLQVALGQRLLGLLGIGRRFLEPFQLLPRERLVGTLEEIEHVGVGGPLGLGSLEGGLGARIASGGNQRGCQRHSCLPAVRLLFRSRLQVWNSASGLAEFAVIQSKEEVRAAQLRFYREGPFERRRGFRKPLLQVVEQSQVAEGFRHSRVNREHGGVLAYGDVESALLFGFLRGKKMPSDFGFSVRLSLGEGPGRLPQQQRGGQ